MKKIILLFSICYLGVQLSTANNIQVSNISVTGKNTTSDFILVQFDLSWENSWRATVGPSNWDAAWVFIKYRDASGTWQHAWLNNIGHTAPLGSTLDVGLLTPGTAFNSATNPGLGTFVYRNSGSGSFSISGIQLRWNYGANGLGDTFDADVQVYAVEMVYVAQGSFVAGDGTTGSSQFSLTTINTATANIAGGFPTGQTAPSSAVWPNGYNAYYCMKYKITQQQYVDFLNTLTVTQAAAVYDNTINTNRYSITVASGVYSTTKPFVACNYLKWSDLAAMLDWMALRPMTELEYEKACRGAGQSAVAGEYAWGNTTATAATGFLNDGLNNETATNPTANCTFGFNTSGPPRVGIFATASSTRAQSGATYYGIMEMSGTVWEQPITIGNTEGRSYTGTHGNGLLTAAGVGDPSTWPAATGLGSGNRGGCWVHSSLEMQVSYRGDAMSNNTFRLSYRGGRGVRTAP